MMKAVGMIGLTLGETMGVRRNFSRGGNVDFLLSFFLVADGAM